MTEAERKVWLDERRKSIGGSDASAVIGLNKYATPFSLWADKTGRLPEQEDNEAMRQGRDLEGYVSKRFCEETGKKVRRHKDIIRNPDYPFAHATIDRKVIGENAGLECKTTTALNLKKFKSGEYPDNYYVQCVHYMAVTGADRWYLAVLVLGKDFFVYTIERDEDEIKALMTAEADFWYRYVAPDIPPPADGLTPTSTAINSVYHDDSGNDIVNLNSLHNDLAQIDELNSQIKMLSELKDKHIQNIKLAMGECSTGQSRFYTVTWKSQSRRSLDIEKLKDDYPEIDIDDYCNISSSRVFKIKEDKQNG